MEAKNIEPVSTQSSELPSGRVNIGELTHNQLAYLAAYVFIHLGLLLIGPLLFAVGWHDDLMFCLVIGFVCGVAINSAAWSVLGDVHVLIRMPVGVWVALLCCVSMWMMFFIVQGSADAEMLVFASMPLFVFIALQVPFWLLRLCLAWRLRFSRPDLIPAQMQVRFSIRHLFIAVTVAAVLMGGIRAIAFMLPNAFDEDMLVVLYLILAATGIGAVTVVCCLVNERLALVLIGGIVLNIIVTLIELGIWFFTLNWDNEVAYSIPLINIATMAVVATSFLSIRPVGLRLWTIRDRLSASCGD
jgi:hypothetical protein